MKDLTSKPAFIKIGDDFFEVEDEDAVAIINGDLQEITILKPKDDASNIQIFENARLG